MKDYKYELIITICNHGYAENIMISAKRAGARGGTIIHGKGTADAEIVKFFGLTIQPEKEILLIITQVETKNAIMEEILNEHGATKANALCFSLPVIDICGFNFE